MARQFIPWAAVYYLGAAFIWWLGRALFSAWPAAEAAMLVAGFVLWTYAAFRYAVIIGARAMHTELGKAMGLKSEVTRSGV